MVDFADALRHGTPWDALSQPVPPNPNVSVLLAAGDLDWRTETRPIFRHGGEIIKGSREVVRVHPDGVVHPMGAIVGKNFRPLQNRKWGGWLLDLAEGYTVGRAGSIKGGRLVYAVVNVGEVSVRDQDPLGLSLICVNGHDGHMPLKAFLTTVRLWCMNQLYSAESKAIAKWTRRHTRNMEADMDEARATLGLAIREDSSRVLGDLRMLEARPLTEEVLDKWLLKLWPTSEHKATETQRIYHRQKSKDLAYHGTGTVGRTLYDAYNGMIEYTEHVAPGEKVAASQARMENRMTRLVFRGQKDREDARRALITTYEEVGRVG